MNERLKQLRNSLGLTLEEFGKRVGVTRSAIGRIEKGDRNLTEQMTLSICREFHVNYYWLTEGEGDMFVRVPDSILDEVVEEYGLDKDDEKMLRKWLELPSDHRKIIKDYFRSVFT